MVIFFIVLHFSFFSGKNVFLFRLLPCAFERSWVLFFLMFTNVRSFVFLRSGSDLIVVGCRGEAENYIGPPSSIMTCWLFSPDW